jgi:hypothetical protein
LLYNDARPHSRLGWRTPSEFAFTHPRRELALRYADGSSPAPVAPPAHQGNPTARNELTVTDVNAAKNILAIAISSTKGLPGIGLRKQIRSERHRASGRSLRRPPCISATRRARAGAWRDGSRGPRPF